MSGTDATFPHFMTIDWADSRDTQRPSQRAAFPYSALFHFHAERMPLTFNGRLIRRRIFYDSFLASLNAEGQEISFDDVVIVHIKDRHTLNILHGIK